MVEKEKKEESVKEEAPEVEETEKVEEKKEAPKEEAPKEEKPAEEKKEEAPVEEEKEEAPKEEKPAEEKKEAPVKEEKKEEAPKEPAKQGSSEMVKIQDLKPGSRSVNVVFKAVEKRDVRDVTSKKDGKQYKVTEVLIGDETGTILLTLWEDNIDKVEVGKSYSVENGYTSVFSNSLRLNIGKFGKLEESSEDVGEVNKENAVSDKHHENPFRRRYGGSYGGGGGGGRGGGYGGGRYTGWMKKY
jgi:replication factor A1